MLHIAFPKGRILLKNGSSMPYKLNSTILMGLNAIVLLVFNDLTPDLTSHMF